MKEPGINKVAIIGAGLMGFGIGTEFARFGYDVSMLNTSEATSKRTQEWCREALDLFAETEVMTQAEADAAYKANARSTGCRSDPREHNRLAERLATRRRQPNDGRNYHKASSIIN